MTAPDSTFEDRPEPLARSPMGDATRTAEWNRPLVAAVVGIAMFVGVLVVYAKSPVTTSFDSRWTIYSAVSYLHGERGFLTRYQKEIDAVQGYGIEIVDGKPRNMFPEGPVFMAMPFMAALRVVEPDFERKLTPAWAGEIETLIASGYGAVACLFLFAAVYRQVASVPIALGLALTLAFSTSMWSVASRALWQHGPVAFCLTLGLWIIVESRRRRGWIIALGAPLALAVICRPTAVIPALALSVVVAIFYTRYFAGFVLVAGAVGIGWVMHNLSVYGVGAPPYYAASRLSGSDTFLEALGGNLFSPGRGIFVFSPVLLIALAAPLAVRWRSAEGVFVWGSLAITVAHLIAVSRFPHWWGGHSFGPRMMSDMAPVLVFTTAFPLARLICGGSSWLRSGGVGVFAALSLVGVAIHAQAALRWAPWLWNAQPVSVDVAPQRLWDWRHLQFLEPGP